MIRIAIGFASLIFLVSCATAPDVSPAVRAELAPTGTLRAGMFFGVLVSKDPSSGELRGAPVDLARDLGKRLGVPVEIIIYDGPGQLAHAVENGAWDIGFLAADPAHAALITFTPAYAQIDATYLVPKDSKIRSIEDIDREGVRVVVAAGTAYDSFLSRSLQRAQLVRAQGSASALKTLVRDWLDALAGLRPSLVSYSEELPGSKVLDGRFTVAQQGIGVPSGRAAGAAYLRAFVEEAKSSGLVARAIERQGVRGIFVAPSAPAQ